MKIETLNALKDYTDAVTTCLSKLTFTSMSNSYPQVRKTSEILNKHLELEIIEQTPLENDDKNLRYYNKKNEICRISGQEILDTLNNR